MLNSNFGYNRLYDEPSTFLFQEVPIGTFWSDNFSGLEALIPNVNYNSDSSILKVCEAFSEYLEINSKWCKKLRAYVLNFSTRVVGMTDYGEFFGSPYLGLHKPSFTTADRNEWFSEIWDVDEEDLKDNLHQCKWVNKDWSVTGDVFNLTIPYLLYKIYHCKVINNDEKHQAMVNVLVMYHYKCLTSIIHNDYKFLAKKEVAISTYNALSLKYDIKRYGSWRALITARAEFIISPKTGIHFRTFTNMNDDKRIIYMVGDIQDRLRGVVNDINKVFHEVKKRKNLIKTDSGMDSFEEGVSIKEISKEVNSYKNYIKSVLNSKSGFYKDLLVDKICEVVDNVPRDKLERVINQFPIHYNDKHKKAEKYKFLVEECLTHLFEYLSLNNVNVKNLRDVIYKMLGAYSSARTRNESVIKMRDVGDDIVTEITGIKTRIVFTSLRTSLLLYIILRTLTKGIYS